MDKNYTVGVRALNLEKRGVERGEKNREKKTRKNEFK
jgi:hypothetical protein